MNRRTSECSEKFTSSLPSEEEECEANCRGAKAGKPVKGLNINTFYPDAGRLQMGWLFISSKKKWTPERIEAYLTAVPKGRMIVLDYESDYIEIWRRTRSFYGQNFIWCYLGNFGGMTEIEGDFHLNAERIAGTKAEGGPGFVGVGATLEGRWNWTTYFEKAYDIAEMEKALSILETVEGDSDYFRFDLANASRQALRNRALPVRERFAAAYKAGDRDGMVSAAEEFLDLCDQLTAVLQTRGEFLTLGLDPRCPFLGKG